MRNRTQSNQRRTLELLAEEAIFELAADEREELDALLEETPDIDPGCMLNAAATVHLASISEEFEPMPMSVQESILAQARK